MARNYKLTWQRGAPGRAGRWRKKYKRKVYYFDGGRGKTDRDAYDAALSAWERLKLKIDAAAPRPHEAEYESAIAEWNEVLTWCRAHSEQEMAETAAAKLDLLRREVAKPALTPLSAADRLDGQFDWAARFPGWQEAVDEITAKIDARPAEKPVPATLVAPARIGWHEDPLEQEKLVWKDRLDVMRRPAAAADETVGAHVAMFAAQKLAAAEAGELSQARAYTINLHLAHFSQWLGESTAVADINGRTLSEYRDELLKSFERLTARDRLGTVKSFVRWLFHVEAIAALPRNMVGGAQLRIGKPPAKIVTFTKEEITTLLKEASERTRLYILLALNCAMTQKDISDLQMSEVDWKDGRIMRRRSKSAEHGSVPVVDYLLWPETIRLLKIHVSDQKDGPVLLNAKGQRLWFEQVQPGGGLKKNDNIRNAFSRLQVKTDIKKPFKSLKKTSASLLRNSEFASIRQLWLGQAPGKVADEHYAQAPQEMLDKAIRWLGRQYRIRRRRTAH